MRILITGAGGMLGADVRTAASDAGLEVLAYEHARLDISDRAATEAVIRRAGPDVVINCAAWTDVDAAESSADAAFAVNAAGAGNVASAAASCDARVIHVSSDYVFDGLKSGPYLESDQVAPLSVYGRSKLEGELLVARYASGGHTIVRSSWLFGVTGRCFPKTILRLASERETLAVVADQLGCPTFTGHLAGALVELACSEPLPGVIHVAAAGQCSWFEFACAIVRTAELPVEVKPGSTADLGQPAPRPANSVLRSERPGAPSLPDWREGLAEFMPSLLPAI